MTKPKLLQKLSKRFLLYLVVSLGTVFMLFPHVWMISTSLKPPSEIFTYPIHWIPRVIRWQNYADVFTSIPLARYFFNSVFVSVVAVLANLFFCSLAGFSLAKYRYPGRNVLFIMVIGTMMIPTQMIFIPLFLVIKFMRVLNTYGALILPGMVAPMGVFLMRQTILDLPQELIDCARIDGYPEWKIYLTIILPLIKPAMAAMSIFIFVWHWNAFLWPMIATSSRKMFVLQVGLSAFQDLYVNDYNLLMAGMVISIFPIVTLFLALQNQFIRGITFTGMKG